METTVTWENSKKILVILAHPDDPEFFFGGTIAKFVQEGHEIHYCLLTRGDKGSSDPKMKPEVLAAQREIEQKNAAAVLGVRSVTFLDYLDGYLESGSAIRVEVARIVRQMKPEILITSDPTNFFPRENSVNHPDHRAAGKIVIDAVIPGAGNFMYYPELLLEGLEPHSIHELWLSVAASPNLVLDVTDYWEQKIQALCQHRSQIGDPEDFVKRMRERRSKDEKDNQPRLEERFHRFIFK